MSFFSHLGRPSSPELIAVEVTDFHFIMMDFSHVTITATSVESALSVIRAEYGARAFREAWRVESAA